MNIDFYGDCRVQFGVPQPFLKQLYTECFNPPSKKGTVFQITKCVSMIRCIWEQLWGINYWFKTLWGPKSGFTGRSQLVFLNFVQYLRYFRLTSNLEQGEILQYELLAAARGAFTSWRSISIPWRGCAHFLRGCQNISSWARWAGHIVMPYPSSLLSSLDATCYLSYKERKEKKSLTPGNRFEI